MVEFINAITGTKMWVADSRKEEYMAAGHKLAAKPDEKPAEKKPVKRTRKKG